MSMLDGLLPYEVVLLILGVMLFLVLLVLLVAQVVRGKSYVGLLAFFSIPIAMIAYPSVQKVQFQGGVVTIDKATDQLQAAPTDPAARSNLTNRVKSLANRPTADPAALASIARAQFALGQHAAADATLRKALQAAPALPQALELKQRIDADKALTNLTSRLAQNPNDTATRRQLANTVAQAAPLKIASPALLAHIAMAHAALGDNAKAQSFAGTALKIDPNLAEASQLKSLAASPAKRP
jgi:tetratricopeptide (TPR) repeat protein